MALVELTKCDNVVEAAMLQARLEAEDITSFVFDAEMSWVGDLIRCRLMVDEDDLGQARRLLAADGRA